MDRYWGLIVASVERLASIRIVALDRDGEAALHVRVADEAYRLRVLERRVGLPENAIHIIDYDAVASLALRAKEGHVGHAAQFF